MGAQAVSDSWSAAEWQAALSEVWPELDELGEKRDAFVRELFALLRELEEAPKDGRVDAAVRIRRLVAKHPPVRDALDRVRPGWSETPRRPAPAQRPAPSKRPPSGLDKRIDRPTFGKDILFDRAPFPGAVGADLGDALPGFEIDLPDPDAEKAAEPGASPRKANRFLTVPVWYMTDRAPLHPDEPARAYGAKGSGQLRVGKAEVTIPDLHRRGQLERPAKILWLFELREDPAQHVTLQRVTELGEEDWISDLRAAVRRGPDQDTARDLLVYIHGYNTSWRDSVLRAAQLARDVEFQGPAIAYSWSSKGNALKYIADSEAVIDTEPILESALTMLLRRSGAKRVHVIAHSMGNRAIINALRAIAVKPFPKSASELREVVFAAPDVGTRTFTDFVGDYFGTLHRAFNRRTNVPSRFTLYACGDDYALGISKAVNEGTRAGDPRQQLVVAPPLETIDVTRAIVSRDTHGYFVSNRDVLTDLFGVLRSRRPHERPGLEPAAAPVGDYWTMRA